MKMVRCCTTCENCESVNYATGSAKCKVIGTVANLPVAKYPCAHYVTAPRFAGLVGGG